LRHFLKTILSPPPPPPRAPPPHSHLQNGISAAHCMVAEWGVGGVGEGGTSPLCISLWGCDIRRGGGGDEASTEFHSFLIRPLGEAEPVLPGLRLKRQSHNPHRLQVKETILKSPRLRLMRQCHNSSSPQVKEKVSQPSGP
jgi:hypothetical protein